MAAVLRQRRGAAELSHAVEEPHAGAARQDAPAPGEVSDEAFDRRHVGGHPLVLVAGKGLVRGHTLQVRARKGRDHHVEPGGELRLRALRDHDCLGRRRGPLERQAPPEHVLEVDERVPATREPRAQRGIRETGELDLDGHAALGEGALDGVELARVERAGEAEPRQLVERRARSRERGEAAADRGCEGACSGASPSCGGGAVAHEPRVGTLDPGRELGAGEEHGGADHS